jgi:hypothetical protein
MLRPEKMLGTSKNVADVIGGLKSKCTRTRR